jgi:hypothetical protein
VERHGDVWDDWYTDNKAGSALRPRLEASNKMNKAAVLAIENKQTFQFDYQDHNRIAEPHDYGILNGDEQVLIYQLGGGSNRRSVQTGGSYECRY